MTTDTKDPKSRLIPEGPLQRLATFAKRLVAVPKAEVDAKAKDYKKRRRRARP